MIYYVFVLNLYRREKQSMRDSAKKGNTDVKKNSETC